MLKDKFLFLPFVFIFSFSLTAQVYQATTITEAIDNKETVRSINLNGQRGVVLNEGLIAIEHLEELNLTACDLKKLPGFISKCKSLKHINLSYNSKLDINQVADVLRGLPLESLSLEGCELPFIPFQIADISTLNHLNVANNYIDELPDNFTKLKNLQNLNLGLNRLDSIKTGINSLPFLKTLDLSFNTNVVIDHLINSKSDFPQLEEINLVGVNKFPTTLNQRMNPLKKIDLSNTSFKNLNQLTKDSLKVDHVIANNCKKLDYNFACKSLENSGVKKLELTDPTMKMVPKGIQKMKSLEEVIIKDAAFEYLPSMNNHKKLKRLTIESDELSTIYSSVSRLKSLEYLDIKETDIKHSEIKRLVNHFPHTEVVYNPQKQGVKVHYPEFLKDINWGLPFKGIVKKQEVFTINSSEQQTLNLASGSQVVLQKNAFKLADGKVYNGEIEFGVEEYKNSMDAYFSGLPMVYDSTNLFAFESGGMYNFKAETKDGRALNLIQNRPLTVRTNMPDDFGGFQSYELKDSVWVNNGMGNTSWNSVQEIDLSYGAISSFSTKEELNKKPVLKHDGFGVEIWKTKNTKGYKLKFKRGKHIDLSYSKPTIGAVTINPLSVFKSENWILIDPMAEEKIKNLKKDKGVKNKDFFTPFSDSNPKLLFEDIQEVSIKPQIEKDNFLLVITTKTNFYELEIIQDFNRIGPKSSKRRIKNQWKRYQKSVKKYSKFNNKVRLDYENAMRTYQKRKRDAINDSVFKADNPEGYDLLVQRRMQFKDLKSGVFNNIVQKGGYTFTNLGACNIDRLQNELEKNANEIAFESYNMEGDSIQLDHVSILSTNLPAAMKYTGNKIYLANRGNAMAIGKTLDGQLAFIPEKELTAMIKAKSDLAKFKFHIINPEGMSIEKLTHLIAN